MLRIELTKNTTSKIPKADFVCLIKPNYDSLLKIVLSKYKKLKKKTVKLYIRKNGIADNGTEINNNISGLLKNGTMVLVANDKYINNELDKSIIKKLPYPPKFPYEPLIEKQIKKYYTNETYSLDLKMNTYPNLSGNILKELRNVTNDRIHEYNICDGYSSFDYSEQPLYLEKNIRKNLLQRECRGLIVNNKTGLIVARRFHKFFNIGQRQESMISNIDLKGACALEKLDGTMVSPVKINNKIVWMTRKSICSTIESLDHKYMDFINKCIDNNLTPIFEWCRNDIAVGVLKYDTTELVLLAVRHNITGDYVNLEIPNNIKQVKKVPFNTYEELYNLVNSWTDKEGVVIITKNANMYKLKSKWYVDMCTASRNGGRLLNVLKINPTLKNIPENMIWKEAIMNNDDYIGQIITTILDYNEKKQLLQFIEKIQFLLSELYKNFKDWIVDIEKLLTKTQIKTHIESYGFNGNIYEDIVNLNHYLLKQDYKILENIFDIIWNSDTATYSYNHIITNFKLDNKLESKYIDKIKQHIITNYLDKKISSLLGIKSVTNNTTINFSRNYIASEGKIKGFYELFSKDNIHDLRIDLQPQKKLCDEHYGNPDYALLLVQYGKFNSDTKGNLAGVFIPTNFDVYVKDIKDAISMSFENNSIVRVVKSEIKTPIGEYNIYCDLDDVLADFSGGVYELLNKHPTDLTKAKMWNAIQKKTNFFKDLKWTKNGEKLWNKLCEYTKPKILSGIPLAFKKTAINDKKNWCKKLGDIDMITCMSLEKYKYSTKNSILIDDNIEHKKMWEAYGGIFIHHISYDRTVYELNKLYDKLEKYIFKPITEIKNYTTTKHIKFIENELPDITDSVIGIDMEWCKKSLSGISIIQIATKDTIYVCDVLYGSNILKEQIYNLMENKNIIKVGFGMNSGDYGRFNNNIISVIDIQEYFNDTTDYHNISLSHLANLFGYSLDKSLQTFEWNTRPIPEKCIIYSAYDANILLDIYSELSIPPKNVYTNHINIKNQHFSEDTNVEILYSCVYLDDISKKTILEKFPLKHKNKYNDHMTLIYKPSEYQLSNLDIGRFTNMTISGYYCDENIQSIQVLYNDNYYHITLSTAINTLPSESNNIKKYITCDKFKVSGTIGVTVKQIHDPLFGLSDSNKKKLNSFISNGLIGQSIKFKPNELSSTQRYIIHEYCSSIGITSFSSGKKDTRTLTLQLKRKPILNKSVDNENIIRIVQKKDKYKEKIFKNNIYNITDFKEYLNLNIVNNDSIVLDGNINYDGSISFNKFIPIEKKVLFIMRGIQGSGKSTIANNLGNICSADDYFKTIKFSPELLKNAHNYCYDKARKYMEDNTDKIVIDNTNSRISEYNKYIELALEFSYKIVILEIYCPDRKHVKIFSSRSIHDIDYKTALKLYIRWEIDERALLLKHYDNDISEKNNLLSWLHENDMLHKNKNLPISHLQMGIGYTTPTFINAFNNIEEFYMKYLKEDKKYITEIIQEKFKLFLDIDKDGLISDDYIFALVHNLRKYVNGYIFITGCITNYKSGLHIKCPEKIVDNKEILKIIENLKNEDIDKGVYNKGCGIRMFGSNKVTKNIDVGRKYELLYIFDEDNNIIDNKYSDLELLKLLSIHIL